MANRIEKEFSDDAFQRIVDMTEGDPNAIGYFQAGLLFAVTYPQDVEQLLNIIDEHLPWETGGRADRATVARELGQLLGGYEAQLH